MNKLCQYQIYFLIRFGGNISMHAFDSYVKNSLFRKCYEDVANPIFHWPISHFLLWITYENLLKY